ncbi:polyamine ABC transporter substrate-binding protein [Rhodovibrionaceae bacterium A322]
MSATRKTLRSAVVSAFALTMTMSFSGSFATAEEEKVLNVYNWVDYIGETTLADFEKETGIKVVYDTYDASETVDAKLLAGSSGYDVLIHAGSFTPPLISAGIFQETKAAELPNYKNLDPAILQIMENWDPGNVYTVPYMWGTVGVTYNMDMIKERIPNPPLNSLDMFFKEEYISKVADCGVSVLESPTDVIPMALAYLGLDPNSNKKEDYEAVVELFKPIRKYITTFDASNYLNALPNKEVCMVMTWSGDYAVAAARAEEAGSSVNLAYYIPETGVGAWFDVWLIPSDAPHPENARKFLDFMMRPDVIAGATNYTWYANANLAANELVEADIINDPAVYPDDELKANMWTATTLTPKAQRARTRAWSKIKTGS